MSKRSEYFKKLEIESSDVAVRYQEKIKLLDGIDPFAINSCDLDYGIGKLPSITSIDIVAYLVLMHCFYTKEQMKAYKSLLAFRYFESGFVEKVGCMYVKCFVVMVGKVRHSQKMNEKVLSTWVISQEDGSICTCMAGNSEVCSHVGALLFAAEYAAKIKESTSCTDIKAAWPVPSVNKVPIVPAAQMSWRKINQLPEPTEIPPVTPSEILQNLHDHNCEASLMRIVEPFASFIAESGNSDVITTIFDIYNAKYEKLLYSALVEIGDNLNFTLTAEMCETIKNATKTQSDCTQWYTQRAGRITASNFKRCCRTRLGKPSLSLIKSVCYPTKVLFFAKGIQWGIDHEDVTKEEYIKAQSRQHLNVEVESVGFVINHQHPQIGPSPDGLVYCDRCTGGCVEIKCPYILFSENLTIQEFAAKKNTCLVLNKGCINLDRNHAYFYQVQMQLFVTECVYCDFVVWSPKEMFVERIYLNVDFWNAL